MIENTTANMGGATDSMRSSPVPRSRPVPQGGPNWNAPQPTAARATQVDPAYVGMKAQPAPYQPPTTASQPAPYQPPTTAAPQYMAPPPQPQIGRAVQTRVGGAINGMRNQMYGKRPPPMTAPYRPGGGQLNWQQQQMRSMPPAMRQMYNNRPVTAQPQPMQAPSLPTQRGLPVASRVNLQTSQLGRMNY